MKHLKYPMQSSIRLLVIAMASVTTMACGGGGGGGSTSSDSTVKDNHTANDTSTQVVNPITDLTDKLSTTQPPSSKNTIDLSSGLKVQNELNLRREKCGINALLPKVEIRSAVDNHGLYINYLLANSAVKALNPHIETVISGFEEFSGTRNPYFKGQTDLDRVRAAGYNVSKGYITENIAVSSRYNSSGIKIANEDIAVDMLGGLLAAPYHQKSLMAHQLKYGDASFSTYVPYGNDSKTSRGYTLNMIATVDGSVKIPQGLVTYPCQGITDTSTALYHESPDPFAGIKRDLNTDPVGQPVLVRYPTAKTISVTNIKFVDTQRGMTLPTFELRQDNDPHKRMRANEMFIIPLTDDIARNSCDPNQLKILGGSFKANSCGLYPNTKYQVSFDISVDGQSAKPHSFTFTTGNTNYSSN